MPSTNLSVIPAIGPASVAKVPLAVQDAGQSMMWLRGKIASAQVGTPKHIML